MKIKYVVATTLLSVSLVAGSAGPSFAWSQSDSSSSASDPTRYDAPSDIFSETVTVKPLEVASRANRSAEAAVAAICLADQAGDYPHISTDGSGQLSGHGWWQNVNCKATRATVTVKLQVRNWLGFWFDVGTPGVKTVVEGGGAGNRATARYNCNGAGPRDFRTWVSIDMIGIADAPNATTSPAVSRPCG